MWYWNETYLLTMYVGDQAKTLPIQLSNFYNSYQQFIQQQQGGGGDSLQTVINDAIYMSGTLVAILPLLILYFVLQRWFVEGIDRAGLTGL